MVILADTSAWIEYLRGTGSATHVELRRLVEETDVAITEPVVMEVLFGARSERHLTQLRSLLSRASLVRCETNDYREAAFLYRLCRANGETIRSPIDCLIAAVAVRAQVPVLHHDKDFDALARHTPLVAHRG